MLRSEFFHSIENANQFHSDRLVVQMQNSGIASSTFARGMRADSPFMASSPGLGMIDRMDRGGAILRVTQLGPSIDRTPESIAHTSALASMMSWGPSSASYASSRSSGMCMIQTSPGADLAQLQSALMDDPSIKMVSRVPIRYLMAKKKTAKVTRDSLKTSASGPKRRPTIGIAAVPPNPLTMWNLQKIRWAEAVALGLDDASSIRVSVLDTGIDLGHPDLPGSEINYTFDYGNSSSTASDQDIVGHGTHVSGTIRALVNGAVGINGICNCKLSAYKIFNDTPEFTGVEQSFQSFDFVVDPEMYHSALARCAVDGTRVINLSIGGFGAPSSAELLLFQDLIDSGVCVVAAMGNEDSFRVSFPAGISGVIAVGASRANDRRASFSNKGSHIALLAPGEDIWSTLPTYDGDFGFWRNPSTGETIKKDRDQDYDAWPGTSMATPHVVAAAALILFKDSSLAPADVKDILCKNADKLPDMHGSNFDANHGFGRLNLEKIANAL